MSVAFRRESDEEHLEPKFERPIAPGPNIVTRRGLTLIAAQVADLDTALAAATDEERPALLRERRYWHTRHATAEVAPLPEPGVAGIGTRVTFRLSGATRAVGIVGGDEADPAMALVGYQAPLARALAGLEAGETADFNGQADAIEVIAVAVLED